MNFSLTPRFSEVNFHEDSESTASAVSRAPTKTAEAVDRGGCAGSTPLKRGVNEKHANAPLRQFLSPVTGERTKVRGDG